MFIVNNESCQIQNQFQKVPLSFKIAWITLFFPGVSKQAFPPLQSKEAREFIYMIMMESVTLISHLV